MQADSFAYSSVRILWDGRTVGAPLSQAEWLMSLLRATGNAMLPGEYITIISVTQTCQLSKVISIDTFLKHRLHRPAFSAASMVT